MIGLWKRTRRQESCREQRVEVALIKSKLPDVSGTGEDSGKGKAPKEGETGLSDLGIW